MSKADDLKAHVPQRISKLREFIEIYNTQGEELDNIYVALEDVANQCFVSTATWSLKLWEKLLSIPVDESKEPSYRRDVILSKIKGFGTVTVSLIDTIAESYDNGDINVIEHNDTYSFEIKFVGTRGIPPNIGDLYNAIDQVKPAHMAVIYTFTWLTWNEFDTYNKTWDQWDASNLTWNDFEIYREVI